jgi:prevent-host-death family protein
MEMIASEFKAKCLHLMDEVAKTGEPIIITKHGKPVAQLTSIRTRPGMLFGAFKDVMEVNGDIVSSIDVEWDTAKNQDSDLYE